MSDDSSTPSQDQQQQQTPDTLSDKMEKMNISPSSFSIWPPTQRTRDAVTNRLIETLSTPSVLSKRYGSLPLDEATSTAKAIEEDAYNVAASSVSSTLVSNVDEGIEILQVYSKEISKRMLEAVKSKGPPPAAATAAVNGDGAPSEISNTGLESERATVASEDVSSSIDDSST